MRFSVDSISPKPYKVILSGRVALCINEQKVEILSSMSDEPGFVFVKLKFKETELEIIGVYIDILRKTEAWENLYRVTEKFHTEHLKFLAIGDINSSFYYEERRFR